MSSVRPWEMKLFQADTSSHCYSPHSFQTHLFVWYGRYCLQEKRGQLRDEGHSGPQQLQGDQQPHQWQRRQKGEWGDTCALSGFCRLWALHIFIISLPLRQSAEMSFWEMSASGFIAVISMSNKSRTALPCLAGVQGQPSLLFATCGSWWTFWLPLVGMCARGDLLMSCRFCATDGVFSPAAHCWFETDSVSQRFYVVCECVLWHVAVIAIQHVQFAALLLRVNVRATRKLTTLFIPFISAIITTDQKGFSFTSEGFSNEWEVSSHTFVISNKKMWKKTD